MRLSNFRSSSRAFCSSMVFWAMARSASPMASLKLGRSEEFCLTKGPPFLAKNEPIGSFCEKRGSSSSKLRFVQVLSLFDFREGYVIWFISVILIFGLAFLAPSLISHFPDPPPAPRHPNVCASLPHRDVPKLQICVALSLCVGPDCVASATPSSLPRLLPPWSQKDGRKEKKERKENKKQKNNPEEDEANNNLQSAFATFAR